MSVDVLTCRWDSVIGLGCMAWLEGAGWHEWKQCVVTCLIYPPGEKAGAGTLSRFFVSLKDWPDFQWSWLRESWEAAQLFCCIRTDVVLCTLEQHTQAMCGHWCCVCCMATSFPGCGVHKPVGLLLGGFAQPPLLKDVQYTPCPVLNWSCTGPVKFRWLKRKAVLLLFWIS